MVKSVLQGVTIQTFLWRRTYRALLKTQELKKYYGQTGIVNAYLIFGNNLNLGEKQKCDSGKRLSP